MHRLVATFISLSMVIGQFSTVTLVTQQPELEIIPVETELVEQLEYLEETESFEEFEAFEANSDSDWTLVWSDEFEGGTGPNFHNGLDLSVWEIQTGNGATMGLTGWGNGEIQYYTGDNVWVEDGMLHIEARRETTVSPSEGTFHYTSGRIRSVGTEGIGTGMSVRYGRIEASISLPYGAGLWPAFWMMPTYDVYGTWAASGEIDIMEARGREPYMSTSAIHYGGMWPHNTHSHSSLDLRTLDPDLTINDFIQYAVEWEPGEMRFLINDQVFWTVNDWHALVRGQEDMGVHYMFPAPFDQYFHVLLNLAIGGWFDGGIEPDDNLFDERRMMRVEYIRVYELTGRPLRDPVPPTIEPEEIPAEAKPMVPPGGQIWDVNFENVIRTAPLPGEAGFPTRDGWELFSGPFGGSISDYQVDDEMIHVQIAAAGGPVYANQLMQRVSLVRGRHYRLAFDARAAAPRTMNARLSQGANPGWIAYTNFNPSLTVNNQTFTHYFTMTGATNLDARLELNLGGSAHDVWIGNVSLVEVPYIPEGDDVLKTPLLDGNMVWNGAFNQGQNGLIFWGRTGANFTVNVHERQLRVTDIPVGVAPEEVLLTQTRIPFANDTFRLTFDAYGMGNIGFRIVNMADGTLFYEGDFDIIDGTVTHEFTLSGVAHDNREMKIQFLLGDVTGDLIFDHVRMERLTTTDRDFTGVRQHPLDNGDFFAEMRSWEQASDSGGAATTTVNDGVATVDVTALGANPWSVILMNNGLQVHSGFTYAVEFDVSATVNRNIQLVVETPTFVRRLQPIVPVITTTTTHRFEFTAVANEILDLKFLMGVMEGADLGSVHISNVNVYVVGAPLARIPTFILDSPNTVGNDVTLIYHHLSDPHFSDAEINVLIDGNPALFTHTNGEIVLDASYFLAERNYLIEISAPGYEPVVLIQRMIDATIPGCIPTGIGGVLINGDFSCPLVDEANGWWHPDGMAIFDAPWLPWVNADHTYLENGGIAIEMAAVGYQPWHIQLNQTLSTPVSGDYELVFTARSSVPRYITVEFGAGALQQSELVELTEEWQTFTIERSEATHVRFLLGGGDPHGLYAGATNTVYFGEVVLREVGNDELAVERAALQVLIDRANALSESHFTASTWAALQEALIIAEAAWVSGDLATVVTAQTTLQSALDGLVREVPAGSNWLINGDFSEPMTGPEGGWWYAAQNSPLFTANWFPWLDASYRLPDEGGIAVDLVNGGYLAWHVFLGQDFSTRLPEGNYELTFTARSTRPRDILIDFAVYPSPLQQQAAVSLTEEWQTFTINVHTAELVRFLLGYEGGGAHNHTVYIQDVQLREVEMTTYEITRLSIGGIEGIIDQEAATITFTAPSSEVVNGRLAGAITDLEADTDEVVFFVYGSEWTLRQGEFAGVYTGDTVRANAEDAKVYTIIIQQLCEVVVEGQFAGADGAAWRLCEDGTLEVDSGFINWTGTNSPWHAHRAGITGIEFTGAIRAGTSLRALFRDLTEVKTIEGLTYFDTSQTLNMSNMFRDMSSLTALDVSSFDTRNAVSLNAMFMGASSLTQLDVSHFNTAQVIDMESMFRGLSNVTALDVSSLDTTRVVMMANMFRNMSNLESLDLSAFNTGNVADMRNMLNGMPSLRALALGEDFSFVGTAHLLPLTRTDAFTGRWVDATGTHVLSSAQLMAQFDRETMAGTWVWQPTR